MKSLGILRVCAVTTAVVVMGQLSDNAIVRATVGMWPSLRVCRSGTFTVAVAARAVVLLGAAAVAAATNRGRPNDSRLVSAGGGGGGGSALQRHRLGSGNSLAYR